MFGHFKYLAHFLSNHYQIEYTTLVLCVNVSQVVFELATPSRSAQDSGVEF